MFISKKLSRLKEINHGFFNKTGGTSKGIYKSLNCGIGSKDNQINIKKIFRLLKKKSVKNLKKFF